MLFRSGHEVGRYATLALDKGRSRFEIRFHNAEAFFNLPALLVHPCNGFRIIFKIGADRVEAVAAFFIEDSRLVDIAVGFFGDFTRLSDMVCWDKRPGSFFRFLLTEPSPRETILLARSTCPL